MIGRTYPRRHQMPWQRAVVTALLLLGLTACGGNLAAEDPLTPIPTRIDPKTIEPLPLIQMWQVTPPEPADDEEDLPVPKVPGAVGDLHAYVARGDELLAFELDAGRPAWSLTLGAEAVAPLLGTPTGVAVATATAWLLVDSQGRLQGTLPLGSAPLAAVGLGSDIVQVDGSSVRRLRLHPPEQAGEIWSHGLDGAATVALAPGAGMAVITTVGGDAVAVDLDSGRRTWQAQEPRVRAIRAAVSDSHAIVVGEDSRLHALRLRDGKRSWTSKDIGVQVEAAPAILGGIVWVGGLDSALHGYQPGGSHLFRLPMPGRVFVDLVTWGRWVIVSPQYGPWSTVRAPLQRNGPADPGQPRAVNLASNADLEVRPAVGAAGVLTTDANGVIRMFAPTDSPVEQAGEQR